MTPPKRILMGLETMRRPEPKPEPSGREWLAIPGHGTLQTLQIQPEDDCPWQTGPDGGDGPVGNNGEYEGSPKLSNMMSVDMMERVKKHWFEKNKPTLAEHVRHVASLRLGVSAMDRKLCEAREKVRFARRSMICILKVDFSLVAQPNEDAYFLAGTVTYRLNGSQSTRPFRGFEKSFGPLWLHALEEDLECPF